MSWLKIGGLIGGVALLGFVAFLLINGLKASSYKAGQGAERSLWEGKVAEAAQARLAGYQEAIAHQRVAEATYHETVRDRLVPITKTIVERATAYAQTPAGAAMCLDAERVHLLDQTRSALFPAAPTAPAGGGPGGLFALPAHDQPGRLDVLGSDREQSGVGGR